MKLNWPPLLDLFIHLLILVLFTIHTTLLGTRAQALGLQPLDLTSEDN